MSRSHLRMAFVSDPALRLAERAFLSLDFGPRIRSVSNSTLRSWQKCCRQHSKAISAGPADDPSTLEGNQLPSVGKLSTARARAFVISLVTKC